MTRSTLRGAVGMIALLGLVGNPSAVADEGEKFFHRFALAGRTIQSEDLNADNNPGGLLDGESRGRFGRALMTGVFEYNIVEIDERCPDAIAQTQLERWETSHTFRDLSQLASVGTSGVACFFLDEEENVFAEVVQEGIFLNGTGRFEGASGTWEMEYVAPVIPPPDPTGTVDLFPAISGRIKGRLMR